MRILHLFASPTFSGPAENILQLAQAQRALGHEVSVAIDRKRLHVSSEEPLAPRLRALGLSNEIGLEVSVKSSPWGFFQDVKKLRAQAIDVVHAHFTHDHLLAAMGCPPKAVLVRSIHAPRSIRWSLPQAHVWTVPTMAWGARLGRRQPVLEFPALVDESFRVPAGAKTENRAALALAGQPLIGMVSTFQKSRRHEMGLRAFALLLAQRPEARMVLVGDGVLEGVLRERVAQLGLQHAVLFAGYQSGPHFVRWLSSLDELWVLGLGNDFSARIAAQARACHVRVVAVDEGALMRWADAPVSFLSPESVVEASLSGVSRAASPEEARTFATRLLEACQEVRA